MPNEQVLNEILGGDALTLPTAAKLLPGHRQNLHVDPATVWRWVTAGAKALTGGVVKLEAARIGGRYLTSKAAIARFAEHLNPEEQVKPPRKRSEASRRKSATAARERLRAAGACS